jgi:hypothetical protein
MTTNRPGNDISQLNLGPFAAIGFFYDQFFVQNSMAFTLPFAGNNTGSVLNRERSV